MISQSHLLGAQVLLHGHRVVGPTLHRGVVRDDDALTTADATDARDDSRAGRFVVVQLVRGERGKLKERTAAVEEGVDAISREEFSPLDVSLARRLGTSRVVIEAFFELVHEGQLRGLVAREGFAVTVDRARKSPHVHPPFELVMIN